jgi:hypothetical protein
MVKRGSKFALVLLVAFCVVFLGVSLVFGAHTLRSVVGTSVNQSQYYFWNISVNNTGVDAGGNITILNITLPSGISFVNDLTNGSTAFGSFSNNSNTLTWTNNTEYLINGSKNDYSVNASANFWFNTTIASTLPSGYYNITVRSVNTTGGYAHYESNLSIKVNDITAPNVTLISPTDGNTTMIAPRVSFVYNVSDISRITNCTLNLNGNVININTTVNNSHPTSTFINLSYISYNTWNVTCTDVDNNRGNSSTRNFTFVSFDFNGTVRDENRTVLNNSVINLTIRLAQSQDRTALAYIATTSNGSGWFNFSVISNSTLEYEMSITHKNSTTNTVDFKSKTIPGFPNTIMQMLAGTTFYLTPAGTINITAVNSSGERVIFNYQVKDTKLGYPVASEMSNYVSEAVVYVPINRNYSIMVYPNQSFPVSYNWDNFTSNASYINNDLGNVSYNITSRTLHKQFNLTMTMARVTGFVNTSGIVGWDNFTIIPYLLEPGSMVHADYGDMPYNLSTANGRQADLYTYGTGFFNISVPATVETSNILLYAAAQNGTRYYAGFRNLSLSYPKNNLSLNFSLYGLLGSVANIDMDRMDGVAGNISIWTKKQSFNIVNASNSTLSNSGGHIELTVDYTNYNATEFTWMVDAAQNGDAIFSVPLLNVTGFKELNAFISGGPSGGNAQYSPRTMGTTTAATILVDNNVSIRLFNPEAIDGSLTSSSISISMYISNTTCDVPNPDSSCLITASTTMDQFNPMKAVMGGGKISFRMGYGGILIHYVNVDMLASGPPDGMFDSAATSGNSGSSFAAAMKFGSTGPTVYDYVLVSLPYTETAGSGLNDSAAVSISIPKFYDEKWNVIWDVSIQGTNASSLAENYSHYSTYKADWGNLTTSKTCLSAAITNYIQINGTNPCYIDNSTNKIWVRLPHFSGTGPSVSGSVLGSASTTTSGGGGSATASESFWTSTRTITTEQFNAGFSQELAAKARIRFTVGGAEHSVGVISLTDTQATINVSSTPQQATLAIGESKKFELTNDTYYDVKVTLNAISSGKANVTVIKINELIPVVATPAAPQTTTEKIQEKIGEIAQTAADKRSTFWIIVIVIIVILIVVGIFIKKKVDNIARKKGFR